MKRLSDLDDELLDLNDDPDRHDEESDKYGEESDKYDDDSDDTDDEYENDEEDDEDDEDDDEDDYELPIAKFIIPVAAVAILLIIAIIIFIIVTGRTAGKRSKPADVEDGSPVEEQIIEDVPGAESEDTITDVTNSEDETTEDKTAENERKDGSMSDSDTAGDKAERTESEEPENDKPEGGQSSETEAIQSESMGNGQDTAANTSEPSQTESASNTDPGAEASIIFTDVNETVTAKDATNLRNIPSQGGDSAIVYTLKNGETATRTGISDSGWSRIIYNEQTVYAVSSYLTTDLEYHPPQEGAASGDGLKTKFADRNEQVTAKIEVNLRALPSVTNPDAVVVAVLHNGEYATRTGINEDVGWSRVEYDGQTLYCVSSYLTN